MVKRVFSLIAAITIILSAVPTASAEGTVLNALAKSGIKATDENAWEEYKDFLLEYEEIGPENTAFGYYNFETGEEYYYNADEYFIAASMYKVPLNMVYAERVSSGDISMDTKIGGIKYSELQWSTIVDSTNDKAEILWNNLGGYNEYKRLSAKYLTDNPESLPWKYYENNWFTPRQFIHCLKELQNHSEKYPGVIDCMLEAGKGIHFKRDVEWCPIASKMGYVEEPPYHSVYNDLGIVYTTETFAIVMFTDNVPYAVNPLADYCTLMCDYTNTRHYDRTAKVEIRNKINNLFNDLFLPISA